MKNISFSFTHQGVYERDVLKKELILSRILKEYRGWEVRGRDFFFLLRSLIQTWLEETVMVWGSCLIAAWNLWYCNFLPLFLFYFIIFSLWKRNNYHFALPWRPCLRLNKLLLSLNSENKQICKRCLQNLLGKSAIFADAGRGAAAAKTQISK